MTPTALAWAAGRAYSALFARVTLKDSTVPAHIAITPTIFSSDPGPRPADAIGSRNNLYRCRAGLAAAQAPTCDKWFAAAGQAQILQA